MKKTKILITLSIVFSSFLSFSQTDPDAWEAYHTKSQPPKKVMDAIDLKEGMIVGEIGAGKGRYSVLLAKRVGGTGHIYAGDIDQTALNYLKFRCERDKINNLTTILGKETDPLFPKNKLDMIFIVNTYHHISDQVAVLKSAKPALKKGGTLVIIEADPTKPKTVADHSTPQKKLIAQMDKAGYKIKKVETFLVEDNIYIFTVK